jgi:hypothetical protein
MMPTMSRTTKMMTMRKRRKTLETTSTTLKKGRKLEMRILETSVMGLGQKEWMAEHLVNLLYQSLHKPQ